MAEEKKPVETLGKRLHRLREEAGMSQAALARASGVPIGTLRNLEYDRRMPMIDTAQALAKALGMSIDELIGNAIMVSPEDRKKPMKPGQPGRPRNSPPADPSPTQPTAHEPRKGKK